MYNATHAATQHINKQHNGIEMMCTCSQIAAVLTDGTVNEIEVSYDGYIQHAGVMLQTHYNTLESATALTENGNIEVIHPSIECPDGHCAKTPVPGHTLFRLR